MWTTALQLDLVEELACSGVSGGGFVVPSARACSTRTLLPSAELELSPRHAGGGDHQDQAHADDRHPHRRREGLPFPADRAAAGEEAADRAVADRLLDEAPGERVVGGVPLHLE